MRTLFSYMLLIFFNTLIYTCIINTDTEVCYEFRIYASVKAFTDESRVRVLELLCDGEQCACVLLDDLKIKQPTLSHHMKILCDSGLVTSRKEGKWNYYSINESGCNYASSLINALKEKKMESIIKFMSGYFHMLRPVKTLFKTKTQEEKEADCMDCSCSCMK